MIFEGLKNISDLRRNKNETEARTPWLSCPSDSGNLSKPDRMLIGAEGKLYDVLLLAIIRFLENGIFASCHPQLRGEQLLRSVGFLTPSVNIIVSRVYSDLCNEQNCLISGNRNEG